MNITSTTRQVKEPTTDNSVYKHTTYRSNTKAHSRARTRHINMIKQKACGLLLALCGLVPMLIEKDATAFVFLSFFFLPMVFSKDGMMFKE